MLTLADLLISPAWAQAAAPAAQASSPFSSIASFMPLILIFLVFYMLIIRPQQKKMDEQNKMIKALKRGDRIITSGGIYGKITKMDEDTLTIEIADGVNVKMLRTQVQSLAAKTDTGAVASDGREDKNSAS